jgi:hypothetical protein
MRIGIDGGCWSNRRGFGRFTRCIVGEMVRRRPEHRYVLVIDRPSLETADFPVEILRRRRLPKVAAASPTCFA